MRNRYAYGEGSMGWEPEPDLGSNQTADSDPVRQLIALTVELARWSEVASRNGSLHARLASALADLEESYPASRRDSRDA